jgi:hypothetical protein
MKALISNYWGLLILGNQTLKMNTEIYFYQSFWLLYHDKKCRASGTFIVVILIY